MREDSGLNRVPGPVLDLDRARQAFGDEAETAEALALTGGLLARLLPRLHGPAPDWEALHAIRGCAALVCGPQAAERMAEQERHLRAGGLAGDAFAEVLCALRALQHDIEAHLRIRGDDRKSDGS